MVTVVATTLRIVQCPWPKPLIVEKKNGEGKGGKYFETEISFFLWRRKTIKKKDEYVWRRKIFFCRSGKTEKGEGKIFGKGKYFFAKEKE